MRKIRNARLRNRGHYKLNNKNIIKFYKFFIIVEYKYYKIYF